MPPLESRRSGSGLGTLTIQFYASDAVSVAWEPAAEAQVPDADLLAELLALFYAQQLFALGRGAVADSLMNTVNRGVQLQLLGLQSNAHTAPQLLPEDVRLVAEQSSATQRYAVVVMAGRDDMRRIQIMEKPKDAATYAPLAVRGLLQWALEQLDADGRAYLLAALMTLHRFYREERGYHRFESTTAGPRFAMTEVRFARFQTNRG